MGQCRKDLHAAKMSLEHAETSLQDLLPSKEVAERELAKVRHAYNDLISMEMDASQEVKLLKRQIESKDKALQQHVASTELLEHDLDSLRARDNLLGEELATLRRDNQRCRADQASYDLSRAQDESKAAEIDKKMSEQKNKLLKCEDKLLQTEKNLQQVTLNHATDVAVDQHVGSLCRMLRHQWSARVIGERQVRAAVGLPPRGALSGAASKPASRDGSTEFASFSRSLISGQSSTYQATASRDLRLEHHEGMPEELQQFVLRRTWMRWHQQSSRLGVALVHAISVWGWRRSLEAAGDLADLVDLSLARASGAAAYSTDKPDGTNVEVEQSRSNTCLNGAAMAAAFSAKRALAHARAFMADFPAYTPADAFQGLTFSIALCWLVCMSKFI